MDRDDLFDQFRFGLPLDNRPAQVVYHEPTSERLKYAYLRDKEHIASMISNNNVKIGADLVRTTLTGKEEIFRVIMWINYSEPYLYSSVGNVPEN